jgi:2-polyprenyl-3-methyl-5-hydroxy-6-metoxy-1,4-benzoquinol methylase
MRDFMSYSASYFTARESWRDWRIEANQLINLARVSRGTRVLEIGCGGGGLLRLLSACSANVVGIDTLDVALNLARERQDLSGFGKPDRSLAQIGEDTILPFTDTSFDAIIGQHVVEHLPDIGAALQEWKRLLKPGGCIALATPNALYPDPAHFADEDHAHVFSPSELKKAMARAGLIVESCYTLFPFLSRVRVLRVFGVGASSLFRRLPYFSEHGRTIMIVARKI